MAKCVFPLLYITILHVFGKTNYNTVTVIFISEKQRYLWYFYILFDLTLDITVPAVYNKIGKGGI